MKAFVSCIMILFSMTVLHSEEHNSSVSFDFVMQDIQDIIYAVSLSHDISIVCDDTVVGKTSFRFSGADFDKAVQSFLLTNRLYARKIDGVVVVSKIDIEKVRGENDLYNVNAYDINPSTILNKLSEAANIPISYEILPSTPISIHVEKVRVEEAVLIIMKAFPDYAVTLDDRSIHIAKSLFSSKRQNSLTNQYTGNLSIVVENDTYNIDIQEASFFESIDTLFQVTGSQYCNLLDSDRIITRTLFSAPSLDNTLLKLCAQAKADFTYYDGMYIIYGREGSSDDLSKLNKYWKTISLKFLSASTLESLFAVRFPLLEVLVLSQSKVQVKVNTKEDKEVGVFVGLYDVPEKTHIVHLQYITTEKLLKHLPHGIREEQFRDSGNGHSLFFSGSNEAYDVLVEYLKVLDSPSKIIGYDLLVLQVQESESVNWKPKFSAQAVSRGDRTMGNLHLGSVFALNLDVVSVFGYTFAAELQTAIGENRAKVYVDTKLQGLSGSPIHFQNTNTFRYQDTAIDPDTGKPIYSGVTREIIAGLVLQIEGWVSGDGMVTTKVTASLSRRGADVTELGNPPPTSEKVVTTEVRGKSGEPIVLSGLVQNDSTFIEEGTPGLSSIPLLGWLFKSHQKSEENTEMIIYLVPHVETNAKEGLYDRF